MAKKLLHIHTQNTEFNGIGTSMNNNITRSPRHAVKWEKGHKTICIT